MGHFINIVMGDPIGEAKQMFAYLHKQVSPEASSDNTPFGDGEYTRGQLFNEASHDIEANDPKSSLIHVICGEYADSEALVYEWGEKHLPPETHGKSLALCLVINTMARVLGDHYPESIPEDEGYFLTEALTELGGLILY